MGNVIEIAFRGDRLLGGETDHSILEQVSETPGSELAGPSHIEEVRMAEACCYPQRYPHQERSNPGENASNTKLLRARAKIGGART